MKHFILITVFLLFSIDAFSKEYDLIVFHNGDSIACEIDSLTDTDIYFMMRNRSQWIHTHQELKNISYYEFDAISKKSTVFKTGTSYIFSQGQKLPNEISIKAGIGFPELLNAGLRYQTDKVKLGLSAGSIPFSGETIYSVSGDLYVHFGNKYLLTKKQPWCGRFGLSYLREETDHFRDTYVLLNLRGGKDIMFTKKIGMEFYFGMMIRIYYENIIKEESFWDLDIYDGPILPSGGVGIFYNF